MVDKAVNDRKKRASVLKTIVGDDIDGESQAALDAAEGAEEAARFIRAMRESAKLTQQALAAKLGVNQSRVSEMERGGAPEGVSYALLRRVAKACGFPDWPAAPTAAPAEAQKSESTQGQMKVHVYAVDAYEAIRARVDRGEKLRLSIEDLVVEGRVFGKKRGARKHGKFVDEHFLVVQTGQKPKEKRTNALLRRREQWRLVHDAFSSNPNFKVIKEG